MSSSYKMYINNNNNITQKLVDLNNRIDNNLTINSLLSSPVTFDTNINNFICNFNSSLDEIGFDTLVNIIDIIGNENTLNIVDPFPRIIKTVIGKTVNELCDELNGYNIGDIATDLSSGSSYICIDNTPGSAIWDLLMNNKGIYGSESKYIEDPTESKTTSTNWQEKLKLTTGIVPAGVYRIGVYYNWSFTDTGDDFKGRVQIDDVTEIFTHIQEPKDKGGDQNHAFSGFKQITLSNASHDIDVDYASGDNKKKASISNVRIEFWRIS